MKYFLDQRIKLIIIYSSDKHLRREYFSQKNDSHFDKHFLTRSLIFEIIYFIYYIHKNSQNHYVHLMRRSFCNKCHKVFYVDSDTVLSRSRRAPQYEISVELASTFKNNFHPHRRLTDKLDTFLESSDNAKQN